ncbi:hypothetical protein OE88DRAFT_720980 [Heliocybe sulcata]|uniref:SH3 domain-containing protein n=1 Tax=Heliocybe sulcata TaxID=5364 RepID=A0A5C3NH79_9AGAM|nr:hypothetical protein OE88DRAFT_720980 [Heliocybe sulcata]
MVFSNLSSNEKDAFFSLLDEYFASRPDVLGSAPSESRDAAGAAASAVHRALASNPAATSQLVSAGLKHGVPKSSPHHAALSQPGVTESVGRVAAAAAAFGSSKNAGASNESLAKPPAPPRRTSSNEHEPRVSSTASLTSVKRFGSDVDTSSAKNMFTSLRGSTANKSKTPAPVAPPTPPAFAARRSNYAPPPVRRAGSSPAPPEPEPEQEEEEEAGEWGEALYDYSSEDPGDLTLKAEQRILIVERTSDDWWTAELNDKRGLVPASYVKML